MRCRQYRVRPDTTSRRPWTLGEHFMLTLWIGVLAMLVLLVVAYLAGAR